MQDYQQRVVEELAELSKRFENLNSFLNGGRSLSVPLPELRRLYRQRQIMRMYWDVLNERIENFKE